jgi:hypothetical protein
MHAERTGPVCGADQVGLRNGPRAQAIYHSAAPWACRGWHMVQPTLQGQPTHTEGLLRGQTLAEHRPKFNRNVPVSGSRTPGDL